MGPPTLVDGDRLDAIDEAGCDLASMGPPTLVDGDCTRKLFSTINTYDLECERARC